MAPHPAVPWYVLFIGGPSGFGKTTVAAEVARRLGASWLQVDHLRLALARSLACSEGLEGTRPADASCTKCRTKREINAAKDVATAYGRATSSASAPPAAPCSRASSAAPARHRLSTDRHR